MNTILGTTIDERSGERDRCTEELIQRFGTRMYVRTSMKSDFRNSGPCSNEQFRTLDLMTGEGKLHKRVAPSDKEISAILN